MIVLRLTSGSVSQQVRTSRAETVLGSDPSADLVLENIGLAGRALRLRHLETEVEVENLTTDQRIRMHVGDEIEFAGVELSLVGLMPLGESQPPLFGGYEDAPVPTTTFELADPVERSPATASPPSTPPPVTMTLAEDDSDASNRGSRRRAPAPVREKKLSPKEKAAQLKPVVFPSPDFGTELVRQLKRSPFFAFSLGMHLLVFFILTLFDSTIDLDSLKPGLGAIEASFDATEDTLSDESPETIDEGIRTPDDEDMPDLTELLEELDPPKTPPANRPEPPPFVEDRDDDEPPKPVAIGFMPGLAAARAHALSKRPKLPKVDLRKDFRKGLAGFSNKRSADIVRAQLGRGRGGRATLDDLLPSDVLVIDGSFDHIERVLDALAIKYVKKSPWSLSTPPKEDFKGYKIVFWNCGEALTASRIHSVAKHMREFVRNGGYLFTTDWGVGNVLAYSFPGYLKTYGNKVHLPERVVPINPARSARDHPLLEGVFRAGVQGKWWLETSSFDVRVGRKDKVTVLIESPELSDQLNRSPVVAATFHYGRGRVLHTMGHYYQEAGNLAGTIAAHRLALNFVLMRLDQDRGVRR